MSAPFYKTMNVIYPLLAQQWVDDYGLDKGIAVDIGTGHGALGIEVAKFTAMKMVFVDILQDVLHEAEENFNLAECDNQSEYVCADAAQMPFPDEYADFIMSRGSLWFWEKPERGLAEVQRILKKDGVAVIGGGMGRYMPATMRKRMVAARMESVRGSEKPQPVFQDFSKMVNDDLAERAGLKEYKIITEDKEGRFGKWFEIRKTGE